MNDTPPYIRDDVLFTDTLDSFGQPLLTDEIAIPARERVAKECSPLPTVQSGDFTKTPLMCLLIIIAMIGTAQGTEPGLRQFWPQPDYGGPRSCSVPKDVKRIESKRSISFYLDGKTLTPGDWIVIGKKTVRSAPPPSGPVMNFERIEIKEEP